MRAAVAQALLFTLSFEGPVQLMPHHSLTTADAFVYLDRLYRRIRTYWRIRHTVVLRLYSPTHSRSGQ